MSEWFKEHAWKACVGETLPWVRIPLSPPAFARLWRACKEGLMRRMLLSILLLATAATTTTAQAPRKKACDLLTAADVSAVLGMSLTSRDPWNKGEVCNFNNPRGASLFN